jgi:hypothetical protein
VDITLDTSLPLSQLILNANSFTSVDLIALRRIRRFPTGRFPRHKQQRPQTVPLSAFAMKQLSSPVTSQAEASKKQPEGRDSYEVPKEPEGESRERLQGREASPEVAPETSPGAALEASPDAQSGQGSKREVEEAESPPPAKKSRPCPARQVSDFKACIKKCRGRRLLLSLYCGVRVTLGYLDANSVEFDADPEP